LQNIARYANIGDARDVLANGRRTMSDSDTDQVPNGSTRGDLLKAALVGAGATALVGSAATPAFAASRADAGTSILDKWTSKKPSGFMVELTNLMMTDLGITPNYVQTPFAQLFAGLAANKFDMVGIAATILPSRALQGVFAGVPVFYESNVVLVKKTSKAHNLKALSTAKFAVLQGSSQQASGSVIFPKAKFKAFASESDAASEVVVGRSDAAIFSEFSAGSILAKNKTLRTLGGPPLFVDANTYFLPTGDEKLYHWVTNWLRYQSTHQTMAGLWEKWVLPASKKYHLETQVVGTNGVAVSVTS
jgi:polar amino acid transport system substrate-binding protein